MTIKVGDNIPEGIFKYVPYKPELADAVRILQSPYRKKLTRITKTKLINRAHVEFVRDFFFSLLWIHFFFHLQLTCQLLRCRLMNGRVRKSSLSQSLELSL